MNFWGYLHQCNTEMQKLAHVGRIYFLMFVLILISSAFTDPLSSDAKKEREVKSDSTAFEPEAIQQKEEHRYEDEEECNTSKSIMYLNLLYYLYQHFVEKSSLE